jgi:NAD(P) transhydrogenase subunit beta
VANPALINLAYLVAATLFILAFKLLAHPRTAVRGNVLGAAGMAIAIAAALAEKPIVERFRESGSGNYTLILVAIAIGSILGALLALKVKMTAMPQMVGLLNGFGGGASLLVAGAELHQAGIAGHALLLPWGQVIVATALAGLIGAVTFWGSLVAFAKLQEIRHFEKPWYFPWQQLANAALAVLSLLLGAWLCAWPNAAALYWLLIVAASALGVLLTAPIGGADMPVVICLLNSYSGLAAAATGFVIDNNALIIAGSLVGASGLILTRIMCKAMNRSLANVVFGKAAAATGGAKVDEIYATVKSSSPEEVAMLFETARRVIIVPGYGMAVAQCQHAVRDLANLLESRGIEVEFAIHPVAGRMPGHMNVLLAEANVSYDKLKEMDEINPTFEQTDVAIVIGANDVVNPLARTDPKSPIAGMPILDVDKARTVVVVKRSLSPGFAGIPNPLFAADNCLMLFGDGKKAILELVAALKEA